MRRSQTGSAPCSLAKTLTRRDRARSYLTAYPPSSPSMALFRDGELVHFIPRHQIEGRSAEQVAGDLQSAVKEHSAPVA